MKRDVRAAYASALRRKLNRKPQTVLTGLLSPIEVLEKCHVHRELLWNAGTFLDALTVVNEIAPFWVDYEEDHPPLADLVLRTARRVIASHRRNSKYPGLSRTPTDWIGFLDWTPEAQRAIEGAGRKSNGQEPAGETAGEAGDTKEQDASKEQPWDEKNRDYMGASDAVQMAEKLNRKTSLPALSKLLNKPDCPIRFMRKPNRAKVHIADFKAYMETLPKIKLTGEDIGDEALDEYMANAHATGAAIRHQKAGTEPED